MHAEDVLQSKSSGESQMYGETNDDKITSEAFLLLRGSSTRIGWCPSCVRESEMLTLERACAFYRGESASFVEWIELIDVHRSRAADGSWLICLRSLLDCLQNKHALTPVMDLKRRIP